MNNRAIRAESWTLAEVDEFGWELFHTERDPLETTNVATEHPDIVRKMSAQWLQWWKNESGNANYEGQPTTTNPHYVAQGDRGSGQKYLPTAMPAEFSGRSPVPEREELLFLDNGTVRIGINRARGASITHLSWAGYPKNVIHSSDPGRLVQQSYYAGKRLVRRDEGQHHAWSPWAWNPILVVGIATVAGVMQQDGSRLDKCRHAIGMTISHWIWCDSPAEPPAIHNPSSSARAGTP